MLTIPNLLLIVIFEMSWESREMSENWKKEKSDASLQKGQEGEIKDLQTSQVSLRSVSGMVMEQRGMWGILVISTEFQQSLTIS